MNREQAVQLIRDTLERPFDRDKYRVFTKNLLKHVEDKSFVQRGAYVADAFRDDVKSFERVCKYDDHEGRTLDVLIVHLARDSALERARTMQRRFVARYLAGSRGGQLRDAAIVAFVAPNPDNWRFSLVTMDYRLAESASGRVKVKAEFTPARRSSFLVGVNEGSHTAKSQLVPLLEDGDHDPTLARLQTAFRVERVTKEFFEQYRELFLCAKDLLQKHLATNATARDHFKAQRIDTVDFAKKLLGQVLFLYFLQKKGWLGVAKGDLWGTGPKDFMRGLFAGHSGPGSFFDRQLEPLFYDALATKRQNDFYGPFNCRIPFLNGGLFDPIGDYDWRNVAVHLPDELFSNNLMTPAGDVGTGILDVFDRYNFTVNEDEPLEKEVAIDPEFLGRIFEKFNAITPENYDEYRTSLRSGKSKLEREFNRKYGVRYTPREIVHFMCQESLTEYLTSALCDKVARADIEKLVTLGDEAVEHEERIIREGRETEDYRHVVPEAVRQHAAMIDRKLAEVRVCDPAVGSGAFPVGMMTEVVRARRALTPYVGDGHKRTPYLLKRHAIENSLFGVDIDAGAIEIARLRLWLSLVVDEDDPNEVKPLPNLDFRFEREDSLLAPAPSDDEQQTFRRDEVETFSSLKLAFLHSHASAEKKRLRELIDRQRARIAEWTHPGAKARGFDWAVEFAEVFADGGFDILVANPPYIRQELVSRFFGDKYKDDLVSLYPECMVGTADIYVAFYSRAHQLLKRDGIGCFISSNKWLRASYGKKLCECLLDKQAFRLVVDFGELPVFEDVATFPGVFLWQKRPRDMTPTKWAAVKELDKCYAEGVREHVASVAIEVPATQFGKGKPRLVAPREAEIRQKMDKAGLALGQYVKGQFYRGIVSGLNDAFVVDRDARDALVASDPSSSELLKPLLEGDDVRRYELHYRDMFYIYVPWDCPVKRYPSILNHLKQFKGALAARPEVMAGRFQWFAMSRYGAEFAHLFSKPKIQYPDIGLESRFCMDRVGYFGTNTTYFVSGEDWYLLGVLNSSPTLNLLKNICAILGDQDKRGRLRFFGQTMDTLPIPTARDAERTAVALLAKQTQEWHTKRRKRVEKFIRDIGASPAQTSSKNMLEQPWNTEKCTDDYFRKKAKGYPLKLLSDIRDETIAMNQDIEQVEREIDERVKALYGL